MLLHTQAHLHFPTLFHPSKTNFQVSLPKSLKVPSFTSAISPRCTLSAAPSQAHVEFKPNNHNKPFPAEVSRTIMELSSVGTLSALSQDGWPLGIGVRFAVDLNGLPALCLNQSNRDFFVDAKSSLHVQLEQSKSRISQCTIQGYLGKPEDQMLMKKLLSAWKKRFGEEIAEDLLYIVDVQRVLHMENFMEDGVWITSSDYQNADPDPLRDIAIDFVAEVNTNNQEDLQRFCNIYTDLEFQVVEAKMIWVDRLGFDLHVRSTEDTMFEVRIPFPREVANGKSAKSSFNSMSQLAWEVEKNYHAPEFNKVRHVKQIA